MTATRSTGRVWPPLTGSAGGAWHGISFIWAANPRFPGTELSLQRAETLCGRCCVGPAPKYGEFDPHLLAERVCHTCAWLHAIRTCTVPAWLAQLGTEPGRALAVAVAEAILTDNHRKHDDGEQDDEIEDMAALLAAVSGHAGVPLVAEECVEGECGHDPGGCPTVGLACHACSLPHPYEDHRYRAEATVVPPCTTLLTLANAYNITAHTAAHERSCAGCGGWAR